MIKIKRARGNPSTFDNNIEIPVTPPSMKRLERRNPFKPSPADKIARTISNVWSTSLRNFFTAQG
jgi:hypothetical protein